jgi:hypothetical protein
LPQLQYTGSTTEIAKKVGSILNVSPEKVDHLVYGYTGGLATDIIKGIPTEFKERLHPIIGRLFLSKSNFVENGST